MDMIVDDKQELVDCWKINYRNNESELRKIEEFIETYNSNDAIRWYTRDSGLYRILNAALRNENLDVIIAFRFLIKDIYKQLRDEYKKEDIHVYRGQMLAKTEFEQMKSNTIGQYISMNTFLSASKSKNVALQFISSFVDGHTNNSALQSVLFDIEIDHNHFESVKPYASISHLSFFGNSEEEVLFMLGTIFKIRNIRQDNGIWTVQLQLCDENDHSLKEIYSYKKNNLDEQTDLADIAWLLHELNQNDKAEHYCNRLLNTFSVNDKCLFIKCYQTLGSINSDKCNYDLAIHYYQKQIEVQLNFYNKNHVSFAAVYTNLGLVYTAKGNLDLAIKQYEKALEIFILNYGNENHKNVATTYNNLGLVYAKQQNYELALANHQKALKINEQILPKDHPSFAITYSGIAGIYFRNNDYDRAIHYYENSLTILTKSLT
ncbi:unnamed protein product, partial [Rotaria sp. Silwood1]